MKKFRLTSFFATSSLILILLALLGFVIFRVSDITFYVALLGPVSFVFSVIGIIISIITYAQRDEIWKQDLLILILSLVVSTGFCLAIWNLINIIYAMLNTLVITF